VKRRVTLGALANDGVLVIGDGYRTKRAELGRPGFRILRVADVEGGALRLDSPDFVSTSMRRQIGAKLSEEGDVLLTTKGTVGRVAVVPDLEQPVVYSPQLCFFRVQKRDVIERLWLAYWFQSSEFDRQASHRANNTDMAAYINLADIKSLTLELPSIAEQRAIAQVLGALDDKITANSRIVSVADELAQALTRSAITTDLGRLSDVAAITMGSSPIGASFNDAGDGVVFYQGVRDFGERHPITGCGLHHQSDSLTLVTCSLASVHLWDA